MNWISNVMCVLCLTALAVKETLKTSETNLPVQKDQMHLYSRYNLRKQAWSASSVSIFCLKDFLIF